MQITRINQNTNIKQPVFKMKSGNINRCAENNDSFISSLKTNDRHEYSTDFPFVRGGSFNKLTLKCSNIDLKTVQEGDYPQRIITRGRIGHLEGFKPCECRLVLSGIDEVNNFRKVVLSAKSNVKKILNTMYAYLEEGDAELVNSNVTEINSNSSAKNIYSYAVGIYDDNVEVKNINTNILNIYGDDDAKNIKIGNAEVVKSPIFYDSKEIDWFNTEVSRTHRFKNPGQAFIHNCQINNLKAEQIYSSNTQLNQVGISDGGSLIANNTEINNLSVSDCNLILNNTHIKKLIVKGKDKQAYISADGNTKIDSIEFEDKKSYAKIFDYMNNKTKTYNAE